MPIVTVYKEVEIEVELDDISDKELLDELKSRNLGADPELLETIWHQRRTGQNYDSTLDQLIWQSLGRVV